MLFAFYEQSYTLTKQTTGSYSTSSGETLTFSETTTETMNRTVYEPFDAVGVPEDWQGHIGMVDTETITRSTVRTGGKEPTENMPAYSPPYDVQITRKYSREDRGKGLLCNETETRYEARQVGTISPVKVDGVNVPHFMLGSNLAIQTHSTPQWVQVNSYRTYYEQYDNNGDCVLSTSSEYSDYGSKWLTEHALSDTGDDDLNDYQKSYAKFSQGSHGLQVSLNSSVISSAWHFLELQGRMKNTTADDEDGAVLGNFEEYYDNGAYSSREVCPHYNSSNQSCNIFALANAVDGPVCGRNKGRYFWQGCERAMAALNFIREQEASQLETPVIGTASLSSVLAKSPTLGYSREIYIDDIIKIEQAQSIANTIASNILAVKGTKGIRRTVTIPYTPTILPDGAIVEVAHDWEALTTSVTYRAESDIPDFLVAQSVSGIAAFVSARENSKLSVPKYGVVLSVSEGKVSVKVGNSTVNCTTKLKNLGANDNVLVSFPSGNKLRGQVIARL